ncbi:ATP-binding protein [Nitrospira sp. M1]
MTTALDARFSTERIHLLLIEDEEDDAIIAHSLLSNIRGVEFTIDWVSSYEEGHSSILQNRHHVCLLDYCLGARTGLELLHDAMQYGCKTPIIMMTGTTDRHIDFQAVQLGASDYVVKGHIDPPLLERVIRHARERKKAEVEREELHTQLLETSRQLGMADIAINVLHNVGNVLTSINVSAGLISQSLRQSHIEGISLVADMLQTHHGHLDTFFTKDPKGKLIPQYLQELGKDLSARVQHTISEVESLVSKVDHVMQIIDAQQTIAKPGGVQEPVRLAALLEQALMISGGELEEHHIEIIQDYAELPQVVLDKHQVLQILVNLIRNAKHAMIAHERTQHRLTLRLTPCPEQKGFVQIQVTDTGIGIHPEHLTRIFAQGFTTKMHGNGIGLHSSAIAAKNCGGSLYASSEGESHGATFTLTLPCSVVQNRAEDT